MSERRSADSGGFNIQRCRFRVCRKDHHVTTGKWQEGRGKVGKGLPSSRRILTFLPFTIYWPSFHPAYIGLPSLQRILAFLSSSIYWASFPTAYIIIPSSRCIISHPSLQPSSFPSYIGLPFLQRILDYLPPGVNYLPSLQLILAFLHLAYIVLPSLANIVLPYQWHILVLLGLPSPWLILALLHLGLFWPSFPPAYIDLPLLCIY